MADDAKASRQSIPEASPKNKAKMYEAEYKHAAHLFDESLEEYSHTDNVYKKEAFRNVMNQALEVLKDTARLLKRQKYIDQCQGIEKDYLAYQADSTPEREIKLHKDLGQAGKRLKK